MIPTQPMKQMKQYLAVVMAVLAALLLWACLESCVLSVEGGEAGTQPSIPDLLAKVERINYQYGDSALALAEEAYILSLRQKAASYEAQSLYWIALITKRQQLHGEGIKNALSEARKSQGIFARIGDPLWEARAYNLMGIICLRMDSVEEAKMYQREALALVDGVDLRKRENKRLLGEVYHDLGNTYLNFGDDQKKAKEYFDKSQSIYSDTKHFAGLARVQLSLGDWYTKDNALSEAEIRYKQGLAYGKEHQDISILRLAYESLAFLHKQRYQDTTPGSLSDFWEARKYFIRLDSLLSESKFWPYLELGKLYQLHASHSYFVIGVEGMKAYIDSAFSLYCLAMESATAEGAVSSMTDIARNIEALCSYDPGLCQNKLQKPLPQYLREHYTAAFDTVIIAQVDAEKKLRSFETEEVEKEGEQKRIRTIWQGLAVFGFLLVVFVLLYWQIRQQKLKAKIESLQAQINPHFISNTLNAITGLMYRGEKDEASNAMSDFSKLNRSILDSSRNGSHSLGKEIDFLENYLSLLKLRFEDKLMYDIQVRGSLNKDYVKVPAMIVQPFVENAVLHGINPKLSAGHVKVEFWEEGKHLFIRVDDDGIGREEAKKLKKKREKYQNSHGMSITEERIQMISERRGTSLEVIDKPVGTKVIIKIPLRYIKEK